MNTPGQAPSLSERIILITGAAGSIGSAAASALAQEAQGLVLFGRRADDAELLKRFPRTDNLLALAGDVTSPADVQRMAEAAKVRFGRIDALVNCAGSVPKELFLNLSHEAWLKAVNTNLAGYALLCRTLLPGMIQNGFGRIVNIATRLAAMPGQHISAYSSSKAGAHMLMRCIAAEIAQHRNVLINDLVPGPTRNNKNVSAGQGQDPIAVVPFIRQLLTLPAGGPSGRTFFRGQLFELFGQN